MAVLNQAAEKPVRRKASKEVRRRQLIEATIDSIAERGLAATTMANVADGAGLSRGIVNFHFESKEKLLAETLRHLSETYESHWREALGAAAPNAAARLWAIIEADFHRKVCNRRTIATWIGLRLEYRFRPIYKRICGHPDEAYTATIKDLCGELIREGGYDVDTEQIATSIDGMTEGLWLNILVEPEWITRKSAHAAAAANLAAIFPKHFTRDGPVEPSA